MSATTTSNYHSVSSPEHFQELLSADLERVSVLYFYADWAEPCASMNQVVRALAEANPSVLFLQIEAEALPEVSESFEVDAVPYTILLRVSSWQQPCTVHLLNHCAGTYSARPGVWCAGEAAVGRD